MFGLLFLLPAMRLVRREIALVAAILVATYEASFIWIAIVLVAWVLASMDRWPDVLAARPTPLPGSTLWRDLRQRLGRPI